jgi:predicted DNA-binding protein
MKPKSNVSKNAKSTQRVRASISFPGEMYETLAGIAAENKVSFAWVVREAIDKYLEEKWPLFRKKRH